MSALKEVIYRNTRFIGKKKHYGQCLNNLIKSINSKVKMEKSAAEKLIESTRKLVELKQKKIEARRLAEDLAALIKQKKAELSENM